MKNLMFLKRRPTKNVGSGDAVVLVVSSKGNTNTNMHKVDNAADSRTHHFGDEKRQDSYHEAPPLPPPHEEKEDPPAGASWHTTTTTTLPSSSSNMDQEDAHRAKEDDNDQCDSGVMVIRSPDVKYDDDLAVDDDDVIFDDDEDISRHGRGRSTSKLQLPDLESWPGAAVPVARARVVVTDLMEGGNEQEHHDVQSVPPKTTAGPPSEIHIDFGSAPTSPMRDPSVIFAAARRSRQTAHDRYDVLEDLHDGGEDGGGEDIWMSSMDQQLERMGLRTKLCDAERLVRVILGKSEASAANGPYAALQHGSILMAIRTFAVMKKELLDLRKQQEKQDGDPPAILTNLPSPSTTRQTSDSTSQSSSHPQSSSSLSTDNTGLQSQVDDALEDQQQRHINLMRNALVLAAKKCQALEQDLKRANETIQQLHLDNQTTGSAAVDPPLSNKTPQELEDILARVHDLPVSSVS